MARNTGRHIAHFAAGGSYSAIPGGAPGTINATAQGMPAPTAAGGYTPGPETNAAGSWGAGAQNGGIAGDTNTSPVGAPDTSAFNQPGNYVAPAAALPADAANVAAAPGASYTPYTQLPMAAAGYGGGNGRANLYKDGGTVQNMKRGGKVRQMTPNGKPGSSQPTNEPPQGSESVSGQSSMRMPAQGRPSTPLRAPLPPQAPSGIPADPAPQAFDDGGEVKKKKDPDENADDKTEDKMAQDMFGGLASAAAGAAPAALAAFDDGGAAPDPGGSDQATNSGNQQSGPSPPVQSALTAARSQFGLNDNMFNMMSQQAGNVQVAGGATPQTPSQQHPTQQHPTQQGGGGFPDNTNEQTKGTLDRLKQLPGLENQINSGPQQGATSQTPSQQRTDSESDVASAAGGGAIPEEWSTKVPQMGDRAKRKRT